MNEQERIKQQKCGLDVKEDIFRYARTGYRSIPPDDLYRFRWYGLYAQKPKNGYFMLRVKIPGGELTAAQMRALGEIARRYARDSAAITTRQDLQFHWITIEDVPAIFDRLQQVGLTTSGACGDITRNVVGCPVAGIDPEEILDGRPYVQAVTRFFLNNRQFADLPRKYKISVAGCAVQCAQPEINDVGATAVRRRGLNGEWEYGFHLRVGGGLSIRPHVAPKLNMFVPPEKLVDVIRAITEVFRDFGYRDNRKRARLKFLVADWGIERFEQEVRAHLDWTPEPSIAWNEPFMVYRDHVGVHAQKQEGLYWVGVAVLGGGIHADQMRAVAALADEFGQGYLRLTPQQNLLIPGVPFPKIEALLKALELLGLPPAASPFRRAAVACTGNPFCNFAITETKRFLGEIVEHLERTVPLEEPLRIHLNGCPNDCGQHHIADIGLQGCLVRIGEEKVEGYDIALGGRLGREARFARPIQRKVPATQVKYALERLLKNYLALRDPQDDFSAFIDCHTDEELAAMMQERFPEGGNIPSLLHLQNIS